LKWSAAASFALWFSTGVALATDAGFFAWQLPPGFKAPPVPADNAMSTAKVALGCRLFFDTRLSSSGSHSCASCHRPELAFTDGRSRSVGATGQLTSRSSMSLANVAYNTAYTWASDQAMTLEQQMAMPLFNTHPIEMGLQGREATVLQSLRSSAVDADAFRAAFPGESEPVSMAHSIQAIAAFERTLISGRSAFDRYIFDDDRTAMSQSARRGMALFSSPRTGCSECHSGLNFSAPGLFANTGVYTAGGEVEDRGLIDVSGRAADLGKFRVPTLRNVALTAPYMHDGSVATLAGVIDRYVAVGANKSADSRLDSKLRPLLLDNAARADLVSFLESLTDPEFANPGRLPCKAGVE
jgi:cytochrome c peroxidase